MPDIPRVRRHWSDTALSGNLIVYVVDPSVLKASSIRTTVQ
jgi:hypothetical protein